MTNGVALNKVYFADLETAIKCCRDILKDMGFSEMYLSSAKWSYTEDVLYEVEYSVNGMLILFTYTTDADLSMKYAGNANDNMESK